MSGRKKEKKAPRKKVTVIAPFPAPQPAKTQSRGKQIFYDFVKGLLFIVLSLALSVGFEHTAFGRHVQEIGYDWLLKRLSPERVPVVVLDISALEPTPFNLQGQSGNATSRRTLQDLIEAITKQDARAIGVDIDFSPDSSGYVWPRDPEFFEFCLRNKVPVFLGISRTESLPPDKWLGSEDYEGLAASMIIPNRDTRKMPKWIRVGKDSGWTLSAALAGGFQESQSRISKWLHDHGLVEQVAERELGEGVGVGEFPVDYSPLRTLIEDKTLRTINPEVIRDQGHLLRGKIVLIGRGLLENDEDHFKVAGFEQEIPGVYIHACAAYTLHDAPLYELTWLSRLGIDLMLSLFVFLAVIGVRLYYMNRTTRTVATHRLQIFFTGLVMIVGFSASIIFLIQARVIWSDFILVLAVLGLDVPIERIFDKDHKTKKGERGDIISDLVLEKGQEEAK